jgi:hypothetical protein
MKLVLFGLTNAWWLNKLQPHISIGNATIHGVLSRDSSTISYFGIPYAKTPLGELRFRAPQKPDFRIGWKSKVYFGNMDLSHS